MAFNFKEVMSKPERLAPGHRMCAGCGGSRSSGAGSSGGGSVGRAASQRENTGSGHDAHERNKGSAFHR